jgi:hypothetical protein
MAQRSSESEMYVTWRQALISGLGLIAFVVGLIQFHGSTIHAGDHLLSEIAEFRSEMKTDLRELNKALRNFVDMHHKGTRLGGTSAQLSGAGKTRNERN